MSVFDVPANITSVVDIIPFTNTITSGILGVIILIAIGVGSFIIMSAFNSKDAFIGAGFLTMTASLFLWILEYINTEFLVMAVILFVVALGIGYAAKPAGA